MHSPSGEGGCSTAREVTVIMHILMHKLTIGRQLSHACKFDFVADF